MENTINKIQNNLQEIKKYGLVRDGILLQEHKVSEWIKSYIESKNKKEIL